MVHRHAGLGISLAESPCSSLSIQINCPVPRSMQKKKKKIPFHSRRRRSFPSEMLLRTFSLLQRSDRSLPRACSMECTYVPTLDIQLHIVPKAAPQQSSSLKIITMKFKRCPTTLFSSSEGTVPFHAHRCWQSA